MTRATWNTKTQSYTVSNGVRTVRNIPVKSQADAVKMDLRNDWPASFGTEG